MPALLAIVFSSMALGYWLLSLLRLRGERFLFHCFLSMSSGLCIWMYLLFALGHRGLYRPWVLGGCALVGAMAALVILFKRRKDALVVVSRVREIPFLGRMYAAIIGIILIMTFVACFAPVTGGIRNDEICLHLSIVRAWLSRGCIPVLPDAISYQAGNAHLLFLLAGAIGPPAGQRLVSWLCFALCLWAIYTLSRPLVDKKNAILAALIAAINPLVFRGASVAFVDMQSSLFVLLPVVAMFQYRRDRRTGWLVLCALFLGAGAGIKPTNLVYGAAFCAVSLLIALVKRAKVKELRRAALIIMVMGGILAAPWPVRTMVLTGSPVFPPPLALFKNGDLKPLRGGPAPFAYSTVKGYYDYVKSRYGDYRRNLINFCRFPWDVTMNPGRFQIGDSIGTLFLCLFPCVFILFPFSRRIVYLLLLAVCSAAPLYFFVAPEARYYIGALMLLCPVLATTAQALEKRCVVRAAVRSIIMVNCVFSLMVSIRTTGPLVKAAVDHEAGERMKQKNIPFYEAFEFLRQSGITDIMVFYAPQNLYYLPETTRYHADGSLLSNMQTLHGAYVLDMDYSQTLERNFPLMRGDYKISSQTLPANATLIFQGPDARIYRLM